MQSFIKIGGHVFELWGDRKHRDIHSLLLGYDIGNQSMKFLCIARKNIELTEQRDEDWYDVQ